jgi:hypothetical protein
MSVIFDTLSKSAFAKDTSSFQYPWDEWNSTFHFMFVDDNFRSDLMQFSDNAAIALCLANCEWVCARFRHEPKSEEVLSYIDAAWASTLFGVDLEYVEFPIDEWQGPVLGPLRFVQWIASDLMFDAQVDGNFINRAAWAHNLAVHVSKAYAPQLNSWVLECYATLERFHRRQMVLWNSIFDAEFIPEIKCPPDALASPPSYEPSRLDYYLRRHLAKVDGNVFLDN